MKRSISTLSLVLAGVVMLGACKGTEGGADSTVADTSIVPGTDTVNVPTTVPTTDTVVRSTEVSTDTIKGEAKDSAARRDTTRRP